MLLIKNVFSDYNATFPPTEKHLNELLSATNGKMGNPSSTHASGRGAKLLLESSREVIAETLGATDRHAIFFTSGATEGNNLIINGVLRGPLQNQLSQGLRPHVVCSAGEHPSVLGVLRDLSNRNMIDLDVAPLKGDGSLDRNGLISVLRSNTALVSIMHVNNETGVMNGVRELADAVKEVARESFFHSDMVQSFGKTDLSWLAHSNVDGATFSAHKIGGLPGVGACYLRQDRSLSPLFIGGGQEFGVRPGTENLMGAVSFRLRANLIREGVLIEQYDEIRSLRKRLLGHLSEIEGLHIHGLEAANIGNTVNFYLNEVKGQELLVRFDGAGIMVSAGSACSSGTTRPSPVLLAMGCSEQVAGNSIRVSLGPSNESEHLSRILSVVKEVQRSALR